MQGKKQLLAGILSYSRLTTVFSKYPLHNKLLILNYHRIKSSDSNFTTPFNEGVYSTDVNQFTYQMLWIKENATILEQNDLLEVLHNDHWNDYTKPCVMVTFDDGYEDNYRLAYPILKTLKIPGTFFLTTSMLSHRELPWWDIITYLFKRTTISSINYNGNIIGIKQNIDAAINFFIEYKKTMPAASTRYLIVELAELLEVNLPDKETQSAEIMTWGQVREMKANGMSFGSHTHTHRVLTTLEPMEIQEELLLSKLIMEKELNDEVISIAFPVGERQLVPDDIGSSCKQCGYRLGYTTNSGVNSWESLDPFGIRRTACLLEKVSTVSLMTLFPEVFLWESKKKKRIEPSEKSYADFHYQQGLLFLGQAQKDEAIACFTKALEMNPHYLDARIKLGLCLLSEAEVDAALSHFNTILIRYPNFPDVLYYTAIAHAYLKNFNETKQLLEKAVLINPKYVDALYKLLLVYCYFEQYDLLMSTVYQLGAVRPIDEYVSQLIDIAKAQQPERGFNVHLFRSFICPEGVTQKQTEIQLINFFRDVAINPNMKELTFLVSRLAHNEELLHSAVHLYEEYAEQYNSFPDAHYALGEVYRRIGEWEKAQECYLRALTLNTDYVRARIQLFKTYKQLEKWPEALSEGKKLEKNNLSYPDICTDMAVVHIALGQNDAAAHWANKALTIKPGFATAKMLLADLQA